VVLSLLLLAGCARPQTEIARQDLANAQATITSAKILGAQEVAPDVIAQAEHYYKQALDDFNQAPKGRLGAYISDNKAFYLFQTRQYDQARTTFERHRQLYTDDLSDNALFWIGETYFMQAQYAKALDTFQAVLREYPSSNKSADAYLSIGLCRNRLNQREDARQIWKTVVATYPGSTAAAYARKFLNMP
jgi:tol-pal system protein YbgF